MGAGINLQDASADRAIATIQVIDALGADRTIIQGRIIGPDKVDRVFWDPSGTVSFSVTTSAELASGTTFGSVATTNSITATAIGGTSPYSYSWSLDDFTNDTPPIATSPSSAPSSFKQTNIASGGGDSATFTVTAADSATPPNTATHRITAFWSNVP